MIGRADSRFEPKGGASVKQQMGKRKSKRDKKDIPETESREMTQAKKALKEALAVFVKSIPLICHFFYTG